jgi:hypothetical protein
LSAPVVSTKPQYDAQNEASFREEVRRALSGSYDRRSNLTVPFGKKLQFTSAQGQVITFGYSAGGDFTIQQDAGTPFGLASISYVTSVESGLEGSIATLETTLSAEIGDVAADVVINAAAIATVDGKLTASYSVTVDGNGRIASLKLLSNGTTSGVKFKADAFQFFDGSTDRALIDASGGILTVNGDLAVGGSIVVGAVRWPVALKPKLLYAADGGAIQWAGGSALSQVPDYTISVPGGVALAAGEAWEPPTLTSVTTTGATLRLKISTPGTTSTVTQSTDAAGGGSDPTRVMAKSDSADAYDGIYNFRVVGTITITGVYDGSIALWINSGSCLISTWFDDGGGWDEGPSFSVDAYYESLTDETGSVGFDTTVAVPWANAIGAGGTYDFGVTAESGGTVTDLHTVTYIKQTVSGSRTGSPNGETATIIVIPKNL